MGRLRRQLRTESSDIEQVEVFDKANWVVLEW